MKRLLSALTGALLATSALPALAAATLNVPANGTVTAQLSWDATNSRSSDEPATAQVSSDGKYLYVRFDVPQRETIIGSAGGDSVAIDLWPSGSSGTFYRFGANLDGSHTPDSTPNTAGWQASSSTHPGGYTVTMKIPLEDVPGIGSNSSRVQFERWIASTGDVQSWSNDGTQTSPDDVSQAGTLTLPSAMGATGQ